MINNNKRKKKRYRAEVGVPGSKRRGGGTTDVIGKRRTLRKSRANENCKTKKRDGVRDTKLMRNTRNVEVLRYGNFRSKSMPREKLQEGVGSATEEQRENIKD